MTWNRSAALLLVLAQLALPACGGDDDESGSRAEQNVATLESEAEERPEGSGPSEDAGSKEESRSTDGDGSEDAGSGVGSEDAGSGDGSGSGDSAAASPPTAVDAEVANSLELGTSLEVALDELGAEPVARQPGPDGGTCYEFRVRPTRKNAPEAEKRLRAALCFKGGKLRGANVINKAPAS